jgi:hypothetical protein
LAKRSHFPLFRGKSLRNLLKDFALNKDMKILFSVGVFLIGAGIYGVVAPIAMASAQSPSAQAGTQGAEAPLNLNWTPPAFAQLSDEAATRSNFSLDRNALSVVGALVPESEPEERRAISKVDGVSVHVLTFGPEGNPDREAVNRIREAYHQRGMKHLVTNSAVLPASAGSKGPLHNGTTDLWLQMDGTNVRAAIALIESPRGVTLVTLTGNISPADLLRLRGHFGIPRFDGDQFRDAAHQ